MSYSGVKRVLGETRLELKCLALLAICLLTLIGGSFWWYGGQAEGLVKDKASSTGHDLVTAILLQRHWAALNDRSMADYWASKLKRQNYSSGFLKPNSITSDTQPHDNYEAWVLDHFPSSIPVENKPDETSGNKDTAGARRFHVC